MANQLEITRKFDKDAWLVTSRIASTSDADFPRNVFLWTLKSDGSLDGFQAIGYADQVARYAEYSSSRTNNFGVHLVRTDSSVQRLKTKDDADNVIVVLKAAFDQLLASWTAASAETTEVYP